MEKKYIDELIESLEERVARKRRNARGNEDTASTYLKLAVEDLSQIPEMEEAIKILKDSKVEE